MRLSRRARILLLAVTGLAGLLLILAATFPVSWFKGTAERALAAHFDTPVRIGGLERERWFSFAPVVVISDIHVAQPDWVGSGDLASATALRVRVHPLSLLTGSLDPEILGARGVRLDLVRNAQRRENWRGSREKRDGSGGAGLEMVRVDDAVIRYRDALQKRAFTLSARVDPNTGLVASGTGSVDGAPVAIRLRGGPMRSGVRWAFDAVIDGPALGLHANGTMAGPLDTEDMAFRMTARADDLKRIDRVIEAGLFGTRAVNVAADVRHQDKRWIVENLRGTIGISRLTGRITAEKLGERTRLDGEAHFQQLEFADLANAEGNARAAALTRAIGPRIVPNTRINIHKMADTDGRIAVRIDRLLENGQPMSLKTLAGVLDLKDSVLTAHDLRIGLARGTMLGKMVVDQRGGAGDPRVTLALDLVDSSIATLAGGPTDGVDGRVDARVRLTGTGSTIRAAIGRSDGTIGAVASAGAVPRKLAATLGFDLGRGLFGAGEGQAALRCAAIRLDLRQGRGTIASLVIDTEISQMRGTGTITFPDETLDIALTGAPKGSAALRLPGSVFARGLIKAPEIVVPPETRSVGNVLKAIGRAVTGRGGPAATDADCPSLARQAIRG